MTRRVSAQQRRAALRAVPDDPLPRVASTNAAETVDRPSPLKIPREVINLLRSRRDGANHLHRDALNPFLRQRPDQPPPYPKGVVPEGATLALDASSVTTQATAWASAAYYSSAYLEGQTFLGYALLAILTQRPEYRVATETIASEMTREWIELTRGGKRRRATDEPDERLAAIEDELDRLRVREVFQLAVAHDGFFGRGQVYLDLGDDTDDPEGREEVATTIGDGVDPISRSKCNPERPLRALRNIEPMWTYPNRYNSSNPLKGDWYRPETWYVMGTEVHSTRLLTLIGRPVPDMLKPAYAFGGLSMSQMMKPYVDNWLRTRQSVSDLVASFAVMGLKTNLATLLQPGGAEVLNRVDLLNATRDNNNALVLDKETEEWFNVSTPLASLDALQGQAQEHLASVTRIPTVKLLGIQPAGLNATSEGELRAFYDWIHGFQEYLFRDPLMVVIRFVQLSLFGEVDPKVGFEFKDLLQLDEGEEAANAERRAKTHETYANLGAVDPNEVREALAADDESPYAGLDLSGPAPGPPQNDPSANLPTTPSPQLSPESPQLPAGDPHPPPAGSTDRDQGSPSSAPSLAPSSAPSSAPSRSPAATWADRAQRLFDTGSWAEHAGALFSANPDPTLARWADRAATLFGPDVAAAYPRWSELAVRMFDTTIDQNDVLASGTWADRARFIAAAARLEAAIALADRRTADQRDHNQQVALAALNAPRNVVSSPIAGSRVNELRAGWSNRNPSHTTQPLPVRPLLSPAVARYVYPALADARGHCRGCRYFQPSGLPKRCALVDGLIEPAATCALFDPDDGTSLVHDDGTTPIAIAPAFTPNVRGRWSSRVTFDAAPGSWSEEQHPRDAKGKFAKKGMGNKGMIAALKAAGYVEHPDFPNTEVYHHPDTGHHVAFKAPTPSEVASGIGSKTFKHLPPPGSHHKPLHFSHLTGISKFLTAAHPANVTPKAQTQAITPWPGATPSSTAIASPHPSIPTTDNPTIVAKVLAAGFKNAGPSTINGKPVERYVLSKTNDDLDGSVIIDPKTGAWRVWAPGQHLVPGAIPVGEGTAIEGTGLDAFNAAFEALHPRNAKGQFTTKPGDPAANPTTGDPPANPNAAPEHQSFPGIPLTLPPNAGGGIVDLNEWKSLGYTIAGLQNGWLVKMTETGKWDLQNASNTPVASGFGQSSLNDALAQFVAQPTLKSTTQATFDPKLSPLPPSAAAPAQALLDAGWTATKGDTAVLLNQSPDGDQHFATVGDNGAWYLYDPNGKHVAHGDDPVGFLPAITAAGAYQPPSTPSASSTLSSSPAASNPIGPPLDPANLTKIGPQMGSNPGGLYEDPATAQRYYVKDLKSADHARNELLAARLYGLAGAPTLTYHPVGDPTLSSSIATRFLPLQADNVAKLTPDQRQQARLDFATHAWLANWDAAGLTGDNLGATQNGQHVNLDLGGALAYRAKGAPKGQLFGPQVGEWDSLRDASLNPSSAALFSSLTPEEIAESASRVAKVTNDQIAAAITAAGYTGPAATDLTTKLIARRDDVIARSKAEFYSKTQPSTSTPTSQPHPYGTAPNGQPAAKPKHSLSNWNHNPEYQKRLSWAPPPTAEHAAAISAYTGGSYKAWNEALRASFGDSAGAYAIRDQQLHDYFKNVSTPEPMTVKRRVSKEFANYLRKEALSGKNTPGPVLFEFVDHGWASSDGWSGDLTMEISVPKGARAVAVGRYSQHPNENEVLIEAGSRYWIDSYDPNTKTVKVTLVRSGRPEDGIVHS